MGMLDPPSVNVMVWSTFTPLPVVSKCKAFRTLVLTMYQQVCSINTVFIAGKLQIYAANPCQKFGPRKLSSSLYKPLTVCSYVCGLGNQALPKFTSGPSLRSITKMLVTMYMTPLRTPRVSSATIAIVLRPSVTELLVYPF